MAKGFINKIKEGTSHYEHFQQEGITLLQLLSSEEWTDYNEHDPGVTILENLSYTFTDIVNKTQLPIRDILRNSKGKDLVSGDNGFFIPSEILTTNPITVKDFRKIFVDQITNVKNVWLKIQNQDETDVDGTLISNKLSGIYHLFIELYDYNARPEILAEEKNRITQEARALFHKHRNLCEDLYDITIFEPFNLQLQLKINIKPNVNGEEILARIYYIIEDYLTHDVLFYSLWELQEQDENINDIFEGPLLENGFIRKSELKGRLQTITPSEIVKLIAKLDEIISVDQFQLLFESGNTWAKIPEEGTPVPNNTTPILLFPKTTKNLVFINEGVEFHPDLPDVQKQLSYIEAMNYGSFKSVSQSFNTIDIPKGMDLNITSYYPVRNQFPLVYGIGLFGLQNGLHPSRYAQASQLKAYLLPFDQIFTNFIGQLDHIYTLYDVKNKGKSSYFYQVLSDMKDLTHLIQKDPNQDGLEQWEATLEKLNTQFDHEANSRLNEVADNLLARFAEKFPTYALRKINTNSYGKRLTDESFETDLLSWKRKLISQYGSLSYNRAKAFDYTHEIEINEGFEDTENKLTPSLNEKTAILLGIPSHSMRSLSEVILNSDIKIFQKKEGTELINEKLEILVHKEDMEITLSDDVVIIDDKVENLRDAFYFLGSSDHILNDTLKNGVIRENYSIKKTSGDRNNTYYTLFSKEDAPSGVVHISDTRNAAQKAINYSIDFLVDLNKKSEGLYLIEHLLLAPSYHGEHFGFSFSIPIDATSNILFKQFELKSNNERNIDAKEIILNMVGTGTMQFRSITFNGKYVIQILNHQGKQLAVTENQYDQKDQSENDIKKLILQLSTFSPNEYANKLEHFAHYGPGQKVNETFFSFQISFVLPSWPVRFQSESFRIKFDNIVFEQIPAHIAFKSYWLNLNDMVGFEKNYYQWLSLAGKKNLDAEQLNQAYQLIQSIQQINQCNH